MGTSSVTTASQSELVRVLQDKDLSKSIKASRGGTCLSYWYFKGSRMGSLGLGWAAKQEPVSKTENSTRGARRGEVCLLPQLE